MDGCHASVTVQLDAAPPSLLRDRIRKSASREEEQLLEYYRHDFGKKKARILYKLPKLLFSFPKFVISFPNFS
jgi:hypothetical protein